MEREQRLMRAFVGLADTLVAEFDLVDFLHSLAETSVELLAVDSIGLMLADQRGNLTLMASSDEPSRLLALAELRYGEGPCLESFSTGRPVVNVADPAQRWPRFCAAASDAGYGATHALPLRLRTDVIGAMNLFCANDTALSDDDIALGQALADIATIGLMQERAIHQRGVLVEQLQAALNSRVVIEQAKGVLSERAGLAMAEAFALMRSYARAQRESLHAVALAVVDGTLDADTLRTS